MEQNRYVDVAFKVTGESIPIDHGYGLFAGISNVFQPLHDDVSWGVHPVWGEQALPGYLRLSRSSRVKIRVPADQIASLLPLAGKKINVQGKSLRLGVPEVHVLQPAPSLEARYVTIRGYEEPGPFEGAVGRQLDAILEGSEGDRQRVEIEVGPRRIMRVRQYTIVGFGLRLHELTDEASLAIQRAGVGGKRKMGAGIFTPCKQGGGHE